MRIVIDFDQTIGATSKAIHDVYREETGSNEKYNPKHGWNFSGLLPEDYKSRALELFSCQKLYDNLKTFDNAIEVISRLSKKHEIFIVTNHKADGIPIKDKYIRTILPFVKIVYVDSFDKSIVCGDIFIDDKPECLESVKNNFKHIWCYGNYLWNDSWKGIRVNSWSEIENKINNVLKSLKGD